MWLRSRVNWKINSNIRTYTEYYLRWIICERKTYDDFKKDMYDSYIKHVEQYWEDNTSIDRINNNWNYCKENCRRATRSEQQSNRRFCRDNKYWYNKKELATKYWMSVHALQEFARRRNYQMDIVISDLENKNNK